MKVACTAVLVLGLATFARGQESQQEAKETLPPLPQVPQQWINSPPLTPQILKDKAVVFWYFEETCPKCEKRWPELLETAQKYAEQPVLFVGVNSGTPRPTLEGYLRRNKITWPILLDADRSFEKASGVGEISLQNIHQIRVLGGDGKFQGIGGFEIDKAADAVVTTAKWHVDPKEIPDALKGTWQQVEFGNYSAASQVLKKNLTSQKADIKEGAEKLQALVTSEIQATIDESAAAKSAGETWKAYKLLTEASTRFRGYTLPATVAADLKELKADENVKKELTADKALDTLKQKVGGGKFPPKSVKAQMEKFLEQYSGTEAADEVKVALARFEGAGGNGPMESGAAATPPQPQPQSK